MKCLFLSLACVFLVSGAILGDSGEFGVKDAGGGLAGAALDNRQAARPQTGQPGFEPPHLFAPHDQQAVQHARAAAPGPGAGPGPG